MLGMGACAAHEVVSDRDMGSRDSRSTRTSTGGDDEVDKDSQADLSQLLCAKLRIDEKKAQIEALTRRRPNHAVLSWSNLKRDLDTHKILNTTLSFSSVHSVPKGFLSA